MDELKNLPGNLADAREKREKPGQLLGLFYGVGIQASVLLDPWRVQCKKAQPNAGCLVSLGDLTCHPAGPTSRFAWRVRDQRGMCLP